MTRIVARRLSTVAVIAALAAACSNAKPQAGLTLPTVAGSGSGALSGTLVTSGSGAPIPGAVMRLGDVVTVTNASGQFTFNGAPASGSAVATASAAGYVFRGKAFTLASTRTGVTIDMIQEVPPFSLTFYRQMARNGLASALLEPTRPWTMSPSFYFRQLTVDTGARVPNAVIDSIKANFLASVPELSGGRFTVAAFAQGDGARDPQDGWVNIDFYRVLAGNLLGFSTVGGNMGTITIRHDPALASTNQTNPYNCASIALQVADHEIIHTMGFWHTENTLVDQFSGTGCPGVGRPAATRYHANVMYSRPPGNLDPDVDPAASATLAAPGGASRPVVACDARAFGGRR